nr:protein TIME FOR COFFEE-like isoform X1 [Ipomoea trifida]
MLLPNSSSLIQDELEVTDALFDLMKQSRSPSQSQSLSLLQGSMKRSDYSSQKISGNFFSSAFPSSSLDLSFFLAGFLTGGCVGKNPTLLRRIQIRMKIVAFQWWASSTTTATMS